MKNTKKVSGFAAIIAAIALFALLMTGCPASEDKEEEGPVLVSITVTPPTKTTYEIGDTFDPTGMVVTANYEDSPPVPVTDYTTSGFDSDAAGEKTITVKYEGKEATFKVTVNEPSIKYTITGSGTTFTAKKGTTTVGTAGAIQTVIEAIKTDATGTDKDINIQFGDGTAVLDIGTAFASFNTTGGTWGVVTLSGKITSAVPEDARGTIFIDGDVSVTSTAEITNTATGTTSNVIRNNSTGTVIISGGSVLATTGAAINNSSTGTVNISNGKVSATTGWAVYNITTGTINISGGEISSTTGYTLRNNGAGKVNITGGEVSTTTGNAVYTQNNNAVVNISGGTVSATTGNTLYLNIGGKYTVSGTAKITSANTTYGTIFLGILSGTGAIVDITGGTIENTAATGRAIYQYSTGKVTISGGLVTSANTSDYSGTIALNAPLTDNTNLRLEITGGRVENTSTTTGNAIYNNSTAAVNISGGTITKAAGGGYAVYNNSTGVITIGTGATVTGVQQLVKP